MLYYFLYELKKYFFGFNVFRYITFRAVFAAVFAMVITICLGPWIIRLLQDLRIVQKIRKEECPPLHELHKDKEDVPTMGGVLMVVSIVISALLWMDIRNAYVWIVLIGVVWLGILGMVDDMLKIRNKQSMGLRPFWKLLSQVVLATGIGCYLYFYANNIEGGITQLTIPFIKQPIVTEMGLLYIPFVVLVIVGASNAVNLTDGLDGLAIGCVVISAVTYGILSYAIGHYHFAAYLQEIFIPGTGELAIVCATIVGAGLGFLWYNAYPAQIFMGDTGSLALGGVVGIVAVLIKKEILLLIVGGVFVIEAGSVILQVLSFKLWKKRIFSIAPIHHHFEMKGWSEPKVTIRFWILAIIFALIGIGSLKLR